MPGRARGGAAAAAAAVESPDYDEDEPMACAVENFHEHLLCGLCAQLFTVRPWQALLATSYGVPSNSRNQGSKCIG